MELAELSLKVLYVDTLFYMKHFNILHWKTMVWLNLPISVILSAKLWPAPVRKGRLRLSYVGTDTGASVPTPPLPLSRPCGSVRIPRQGKPNNLLSIMELLSDIVYWALYAFFFGGCILILGAQSGNIYWPWLSASFRSTEWVWQAEQMKQKSSTIPSDIRSCISRITCSAPDTKRYKSLFFSEKME